MSRDTPEKLAFISAEAVNRAQTGDSNFSAASPYPHLVIDDFLKPEVAEGLLAEFPETADWTYLYHVNEKKRQLTRREEFGELTRAVIDELQSPAFIALLTDATGLSGLIPDPDLEGSGLHEIRRGGFLNIHTDFLTHVTRTHWSRQLNLLLYLNPDWKDEYGGHFEMWNSDVSGCANTILPIFNRCVIFQTSEISFHGHPDPLNCPPDRARRSLALYYYRDEGAPLSLSSTRYMPRPDDSLLRRGLIMLDRAALRVYTALKRRGGISDEAANRILRFFR